jgi:hypothetical protein
LVAARDDFCLIWFGISVARGASRCAKGGVPEDIPGIPLKSSEGFVACFQHCWVMVCLHVKTFLSWFLM